MTSLSFQILSDQEVIDMKRSRGIMACAECQRRKLKCNKNFPCSSCVRRGRADICPTGDLGPIGRGRRITRTDCPNLGDRIRQKVAHGHPTGSLSPQREPRPAIKRSKALRPSSKECSPPVAETFSPLRQKTISYDHIPSADLGLKRESVSPMPRETLSSDDLWRQLPDEPRAWALYEVYVADASWYATPILPDELHELIKRMYNSTSKLYDTSPHALAVIFFTFSLASLADLSLPAYDSQADIYFGHGCAALARQSIYGSTDLNTIQALILAGLYCATGGPRYDIDAASRLTSMATGLCQTLGLRKFLFWAAIKSGTLLLDREADYTRFDDKIAQRRRALFWETYSLDTYQSLILSSGHSLTIALADISCEFPADTGGEGGMSEFLYTKWTFTREVTAPIAEVYTRETPPTYHEVADFDQRLRQFLDYVPVPRCFDETTFSAYVYANFIPRFVGTLMMYIHRASFIQVLQDWPLNPLASPHAASFLAAFHGASMIVKSDMRSFSLYPERFYRWWPIWSSLVNASFIFGSIITKSPISEIAPVAFAELLEAVELVHKGAMHSSLAESNLPLLRRLRNKATAAYNTFYPLPIHELDLADDEDWAIHEGKVAVPSLIPGLMPPPSEPEPFIPIAEVHGESFPFHALNHPAVTFPYTAGMEAYLADRTQATFVPDNWLEGSSTLDDWMTFV
ncbi:Zn(2)-C6 fungal-type domain-containing protein [Mycena sanguinolenta]|uniref:Zn(2)-C6 fungal-type domain-containing protein n=1 Tax=Mycena sanguinolenta TaxID=230812 RepID=A0A8H7DLU8_9AGAR|nr:Zn(2)-C6 fungal-type domain-containing protein [Mycena sanguinolenta]